MIAHVEWLCDGTTDVVAVVVVVARTGCTHEGSCLGALGPLIKCRCRGVC